MSTQSSVSTSGGASATSATDKTSSETLEEAPESVESDRASTPVSESSSPTTTLQPHQEQQQQQQPLWTPVLIRGDPCGVLAAAKLLVPLLHPTPNPSQLDPSYDPASDMDDVVLEVPIPRARHAAIIGKKGLTIANLSADFNVRIMVPHRNPQLQLQQQQQQGTEDESNGGIESGTNEYLGNLPAHQPTSIHIVQLEGQLENVEKCLASLFQVVCGSSSPHSGGGGGGSKPLDKEDNTKDAASSEPALLGGGNSQTNPMTEIETNLMTTTLPTPLDSSSAATTTNNTTPTLASWSIRTTQSKTNKFLEQLIIIPPTLYQKVPSLGRIRNVGKATGTVIRRKRITVTEDGKEVETTQGKIEVVVEEQEEEGDAGEEEGGGKEKVESVIPVTHLLVSGKVEGVKAAVAQFENMLVGGEDGEGGEDIEETNGNGSRKSGPKRRSGRGGGRGRGGKKRGSGRGGRGGHNSNGGGAVPNTTVLPPVAATPTKD